MQRSLSLALALAALTPSFVHAEDAPFDEREMDADDPLTLAAPARMVRRHDRGLSRARVATLASGAGAIVAGWLGNGLVSSFAGAELRCGDPGIGVCVGYSVAYADAWRSVRELGWIPIIGPWAQLGATPNRFGQDGWGTAWVTSGLVQLAGVGLIVASLALDLGEEDDAIALVPVFSRDQALVTIGGRF